MSRRCVSPRQIVLAGLLACGLLAVEGFAADPVVLTLIPESSFSTGCIPPCLCPILFRDGLQGTLTFTLKDSNPLFDAYDVVADLSLPGDPPAKIDGSGAYRIGGEVAVTQSMSLDLSVDGQPPQVFSTETVVVEGKFPDSFSIRLATSTDGCMGSFLDLKAKLEGSTTAAFERADCNSDGQVDLSDAVRGLLFLFGGGEAPTCLDACDANDDGKQDISDAVSTLNRLFLGGDPFPPPTGACGVDPTEDELGCSGFAPCVASCEAQVQAIAAETGIVGSCTAAIRLAYPTREILAWQLVCGKYKATSETEARARAEEDTGYGNGKLLSAAEPVDEFVFYTSPGDFGGASAVSARTGLTVFGGSIIWSGTGAINFPTAWRDPESLGKECAPYEGKLQITAYNLVEGGGEVPPGELALVEDVVRRTAIFDGLATSGYVFDVVVLLYPRTVGVFDPATAEWIVLVNGGWLE